MQALSLQCCHGISLCNDYVRYNALLWNKLYTGKCIYWIAFDARSVCAFITTCTNVESDFCHFNVNYSPLKVLSY